MTTTSRLLLVAYNVVWWVPVALPLLGVVSYRAGTVAFLAVTATRAAINLYRNNALPSAAAQRFPLRSP
jgi:hypothetical protein